MFEITSAIKGFLDRITPGPISLDLKGVGGDISFDLVNVGWYARNGVQRIYSIVSGGMPAWSGEPVSIETALNHSVVWVCYSRATVGKRSATTRAESAASQFAELFQRVDDYMAKCRHAMQGVRLLPRGMPQSQALRHSCFAGCSAELSRRRKSDDIPAECRGMTGTIESGIYANIQTDS